jgi:hypothetical protein
VRILSSRATFFYKRVFPAIWFGFLALFVVLPLIFGGNGRPSPPEPFFIIIPAGMAVFGYVIMRRLIFDIVDEVVDLGDALGVRNGKQEERIPLSDITNVNYVPIMNPPRVTLSLRRPGLFGSTVTFCAPAQFMPFSSSPVIDELIARIDAARSKS